MRKSLAPCFLFLFLSYFHSFAQVITTIAGVDSAGYNGDGGAAVASALNHPFSIAVNNSGNVFIADRYNSRIRMVSAAGIISTIAGTGVVGFSGDGGPATLAQIGWPTGVAADDAGNVFFADKGNNVIRKINPAGFISTFAGNGTAGSAGDGGPATAAGLNQPNGVAVDIAGNVFIADQGNSLIRKVSLSGMITTIAGTGTLGYNGDGIPATNAQLQNPYTVAADRTGNVYICDVDNERIRKVSPDGIITTVAGNGTGGSSGNGGPASAAELSEPIGVAVDSAGNVYIADAWNSRICVVNTYGILNTVAGTGTAGFSGDGGPAIVAGLNSPYGVAVDRSGVYVADYANNRIRFITYSVTGVNAVAASSYLKVYPNPSSGRFSVSLSSVLTAPVQVIISNAPGQVCYCCSSFTNLPVSVALESQPGVSAGLYFISVITANGRWVEPIVIEGGK
jgi:hypothetical protein